MSNLSLNMLAPINRLGYGQASFYIAKELNSLSNLHLTVIGQTEQQDGFLQECANRPYHRHADCLRIYHQFALKEFIGKGRHVGFPIFELDEFTDAEKHQLNSLDMLFVCSDWAKGVCEANGINTEIHVVPLGVDRNIFNEDRSNPIEGKTIFFNCGKWEVRKGHFEIAEAFSQAFRPGDPVELWLMCDNPFYPPKVTQHFKNQFMKSPMAKQVRFVDRVGSHLQVAKIMSAVTAGVFPAKAEGWNLELLEMMSLGKHVIATNYSGHTQFCNKDNARLIEPTGTERAIDNIWFKGQGNWCTFSVQDLSILMSEIHMENMSGNLGINVAGIETAKRLTWTNTAEKIINALNSE